MSNIEPSKKSEEIDQYLKDKLGIDRKARIAESVCAFCNSPATEFKDELSRKEYSISGLCQECQDKTFG